MLVVPIDYAKNVEKMNFNTDTPMFKYCQNTSNSCYFSDLVSAFEIISKIKARNSISKRREESLTSQVSFRNPIDFAKNVLKNQKICIGKQVLYYNLKNYKQKNSFNILNNMGENVTLVQLLNYLGNGNHSISVVGYWIFDTNYEKTLVLNRKSNNKSLSLKQCFMLLDTFDKQRN